MMRFGFDFSGEDWGVREIAFWPRCRTASSRFGSTRCVYWGIADSTATTGASLFLPLAGEECPVALAPGSVRNTEYQGTSKFGS